MAASLTFAVNLAGLSVPMLILRSVLQTCSDHHPDLVEDSGSGPYPRTVRPLRLESHFLTLESHVLPLDQCAG